MRRPLPPLLFPALLATALLGFASPGMARDVFVAPEGAAVDATPDGGRDRPFASVQAAFDGGGVAQEGGRILLLPGEHGDLRLDTARARATVEIAPAEAGAVHVQSIYVERGENLDIHGLQVWPTRPRADGVPSSLVTTRARSRDVTLRDLDVRARPDAENYLAWSLEDWRAAPRNGAQLRGRDIALLDSRFTATHFAIATLGERARVEGNVIAGFSGDAMRGLGDGSVFRGNRVSDCIKFNDNHDDGFQSWSRGDKGASGKGVVRDVVVESNVIREWTGPKDHPLRCHLQGIGLFDGIYQNWTIRNNVVEVSAYHGIAVYGGVDVTIVNNTVVRSDGGTGKFPWVKLTPHKDGRPSTGGVVANNLAMRFDIKTDPAHPAVVERNAQTPYPNLALRSPGEGDFRPEAGGPAFGSADPRYAPPTDAFGRPRGERPSLGAVEP
ncbi:MAG: right-handed parallel beta-helix repeat-containing protein [Pseudomonadota bacterium]|nr:right-handed parallel beta-helix repeat-containing protein [Pseudomonadota bacterium]